MTKRHFILTAALFLLLGVTVAHATPVIKRIPYEKATSLPKPGTYTIRFSLWDAVKIGSGNQVWSEEKTINLTSSSIIRTELGGKNPLDDVDFSQQLWVQVESEISENTYEVLGSRDRLKVVPYAMWSATTTEVVGATPSDTVTTLNGTSSSGSSSDYSRGDHKHGIGIGAIKSSHILDNTITNTDISPDAAIDYSKLSGVASSAHTHDSAYVNAGEANSITSAMIVNGTINFSDIGQNGCSANQVMKWDGSAWVCVIDDLGNHIATQNIQLNGHWLSGDGGNEGVFVDSAGKVGVGVAPSQKLDVKGSIRYRGVKQINETLSTYDVDIKRYYVEATNVYVLDTVPLQMDIVNQLCRDEDGCSVTVGMRDWSNDRPGEVASRGPFRLFLSQTSNWWRLSNNDTYGVDGDGFVAHILNTWDCYLTDGEYVDGVATDSSVQLGLLYWNTNFQDTDKVCILIIED
jgi:hypothetical protein